MNEETQLLDLCSQTIKDLYVSLKLLLGPLGDVKFEFKKTSIHCLKKVAFLGIHPKKNWIDLNIVLDRPLLEMEGCKSEQISKNRFHNEVRIIEISQLEKLKPYIIESYRKSKSI